jgi:hypothetical protein
MWLDKLKARIIPDWKQAWKFVSVRSWVVALALIAAWVLIPESLRSYAPKEAGEWIFYLVFAFGFIGLVGRVTKQRVVDLDKILQPPPQP